MWPYVGNHDHSPLTLLVAPKYSIGVRNSVLHVGNPKVLPVRARKGGEPVRFKTRVFGVLFQKAESPADLLIFLWITFFNSFALGVGLFGEL